ncbi:aminodeoxychorismate synthase component I [Leifsonia sp. NPDC080035]|uniref:Aminodeoxychorismate synthase component I n=1 Tax=Leifsonia sp. NPDC080035 TaxID=3143936 RepID=A0AAU7GAE0_9MICO
MPLPPRVQRLDAVVDPADAFAALFGGGDAVWLDAGPGATTGRSILGTGTRVVTGSDLGVLDEVRAPLAGRADEHPVGWVGWIGYEAGAASLGVPHARDGGADIAMLFVDRLVVVDHAAGTLDVVDARESSDGDDGWLAEAVRRLRGAAGAADAYEAAHPVPAALAGWRHGDEDYLARIRACQDAIRAGDAYQLCLTNTATGATAADPLAVHLRLRRYSPSHHGGLLRIGGDALVSSSPEQFLHVEPDGAVRTEPIKGTRPRGSTEAEDARLRQELLASEKERAENVMIVDLMRNDLGRVCEVGSVAVSRLLAVESYAQVHQLVSTVEGRLRPGLGAVDAIAACFPAGSMTGAPKLSAMRILSRLEHGPRGVYAGCFGRLGTDGSADLAMVIRSIRFLGGTATVGAGGGITALSVPEEELEEVRVKAAALFRAVGFERAGNGLNVVNV